MTAAEWSGLGIAVGLGRWLVDLARAAIAAWSAGLEDAMKPLVMSTPVSWDRPGAPPRPPSVDQASWR